MIQGKDLFPKDWLLVWKNLIHTKHMHILQEYLAQYKNILHIATLSNFIYNNKLSPQLEMIPHKNNT